ncbi:MAG: Fic family protein [Armatimonadetes bacterium]|nr:Fic family protein [Armatimonadota bacterium]
MPTYIHELPTWPEYTYDATALLRPLELATTKRGRLFGILEAIGFESLQEHNVEALTAELVKSSAIEGESLDLETVRNSVARRLGMAKGGLAGDDHYIDGLVQMAIDAAQQYTKPLTAERIFNWHAALFPTGRNADGPVTVGSWRNDHTGPMVVASQYKGREIIHFEAPSADKLALETAQFLDWYETKNEPSLILKAGIAHLWFETLHPLDDGNGRIGRNILDMTLARADAEPHRPYALSASIHLDRESYYEVLETTQKGTGDYTAWLDWYLNCLSTALDDATETVGKALARTRFWHNHKDIELNERQRRAVSRMLIGWEGKMTNKKYARLTDCSDATATRDLGDLVEKGVLKPDAAGGRSAGYELVAVDR